MLSVVLVTEDWMPFSHTDGWAAMVEVRESAALRFYEAAIWEETASVHLYAFTNEFDPYFALMEQPSDAEAIAYREQHAISVHNGMPEEESSGARSAFLRGVFEDFASILVKRHPEAEHHLMYSGHGGPTGDLFAQQLQRDDAAAFLSTWTRLLDRPLGVIDMGGPCNKGSYEDLANFCRYTRYYVGSDRANGGYELDDWTFEKHRETEAPIQYHRILAGNASLEDALVERVDLSRTRYEYARNNQTENRWEQSSYLYSCDGFKDFSSAFEAYIAETVFPAPATYDLKRLMVEQKVPPNLLELFDDIFVHSVDNRDFFEWRAVANGLITPVTRLRH